MTLFTAHVSHETDIARAHSFRLVDHPVFDVTECSAVAVIIDSASFYVVFSHLLSLPTTKQSQAATTSLPSSRASKYNVTETIELVSCLVISYGYTRNVVIF